MPADFLVRPCLLFPSVIYLTSSTRRLHCTDELKRSSFPLLPDEERGDGVGGGGDGKRGGGGANNNGGR